MTTLPVADDVPAPPSDDDAPLPSTLLAPVRPRATVVIPVLDNRDFVAAQVESLIAQWRPDLELLVIDDGSSDGSLGAVREALAGRTDVAATLLRNERTLGMGLLPILLRHAAGDIIVQADSDDVALPGRLDAILACFDADPSCRLVTSNAVKLSAAGVPIGLWDTSHGDEVLDDPLRAAGEFGSALWLGATAAFHRSLLADFPPIEPNVCPYGLDLLTAFRAVLTGTHHYLARTLVGWRQHGRNTHRLAGAFDGGDLARERYEALELMVLAQKIRDAEAVGARSRHHADLGAILARCHATFLDRFVEWSRVRNRVARGLGDGSPKPAANRSSPMPPIVTIAAGVRRRFGHQDPLGIAAAEWSGIHDAEEQWNWTAASALLVVRLGSPRVERVRLGLRCPLADRPSHRVRVSVDFGTPVELSIDHHRQTEVDLPIREAVVPGHLVLQIEAPDAAPPAVDGNEHRLLGVILDWIVLV